MPENARSLRTAAARPDRGAPRGVRRGPLPQSRQQGPEGPLRGHLPHPVPEADGGRDHGGPRARPGLPRRELADAGGGRANRGRDHRLLGAERRGEDPGRSRGGVLPARLHHGRHPLRDAARRRGHRRRAVRGVHAAAAAVRRRPPPVLPRGGREGRAARKGDVRGHHPDRVARRLGVHVRRAREGAPEGRRARPPGGDRPLERLRRPQAVPPRRRHPRATAPAARVAVGRRPLHERSRARADGRSHRATAPGSTTR